jgi:hypothetical protein
VAAPEGSLGSEAQVRLEMVPLNAQPGDCYVLATHPLREGELSLLARDLASTRDVGSLLRTACSGTPESGRVAIATLSGEHEMGIPSGEGEEPREMGPLELEPIEPTRAEAAPFVSEPAAAAAGDLFAPEWRPPDVQETAPEETPAKAPEEAQAAARDLGLPPPHSTGGFVERRPWYEWVALWGGGALSLIALALLIRAILPGIVGTPHPQPKMQEAAAPLGTGSNLDLFSDPPGAAVKVDGVALPTRTPATDIAVSPGTHRVDMDWGVYGQRRDTVSVARGGRVTLRPRVLGSVGFRSSDAARVLDVFVDGAYVGSTPVALDSMVVGRHLVRFGGPGLNSTAQEVEVLQGTRVELIGSAGAPPEPGGVTVRSAILSDTGFESGRGDPVWVDGEVRGVTPLTVNLRPGAHSFRVLRRGFPPQITVLEVKPGGDQFISAEFGARSEDPLRFTPPTGISLSNLLPVTIALPEGEWDQSMTLWVYAAPPGGSFQARQMTRLDDASKLFAALLPAEVLRNSARQVKVYFKAVGAAGREIYSEIYTLPVKN